jgi:hypothetical protein
MFFSHSFHLFRIGLKRPSDEAAHRVRARCYELLDLDEPADESPVPPYPVRPVPRPVVDAVLVDGVVEADGLVRMRAAAG